MTRLALLGGAVIMVVAAVPAEARDKRVVVQPYIELSQTADADLKSGDVLTYTSVAAGVDASIDTRRTSAQLSYRYERRIGETDGLPDSDVHSGLARVSARVSPVLTLEAGALAARARSDIRGAAPGVLAGDTDNVSQIYSLYAGPTVATQAGLVNLSALYRIGYTKAEAPRAGGFLDGPRLDAYDESVGQLATGSIGVAPYAVLPVGLTASAGWSQERAGQLHQHFDDWYVRGDVLAPISANVALAAGVGYEKLTTSQRSPLFTAPGVPAVDADGRFVTDPASPRRITYRTDGLYYDVGVVWRPNRRTSVSAYAGKRYGSESYTGAISYQASRTVGFGAQVYDNVTTFGQQLRTGIANLPTSFITTRDQFAQAFNGCTYGANGASPGGCLNQVFQSVTTASYRARGVDAVLSATRGPATFGIGGGYANRKLFAPDQITGAVIYGREDQSWYGDIFYQRQLTPVSGFNAQAFVSYYDPALVGAEGVVSAGATASYYHDFGRLGTTAALGLYSFRVGDGIETSLRGQALLGARYNF